MDCFPSGSCVYFKFGYLSGGYVLAKKTRAKEMLLRLEFKICLSTGAKCYINGLDNLDTIPRKKEITYLG